MRRPALIFFVLAVILVSCGSDEESGVDSNQATVTPSSSSPQDSDQGADSPQSSLTVSVLDLRRGDCFIRPPDISAVRDVDVVSCSLNWEYRILTTFEVGASGVYPEESYFEEQANVFCHPNTTDTIVPGPNGWADGDRTILCIQER